MAYAEKLVNAEKVEKNPTDFSTHKISAHGKQYTRQEQTTHNL